VTWHLLLVTAAGGTGVYCLVRVLRPGWRAAGQPLAVDLLHVAMAAGMVVMLLLDLAALVLVVLAVAFGIGTLWCLGQLFLPTARTAYTRLAVSTTAMSAMFAATWARPAGAQAAAPMDQVMAHDMRAMPGMDHTGSTTAPGSGHSLGQLAWLDAAVLLVVALAAVVALVRSRGGRHCRIGLGCEAVMAAAMAVMFVEMA
jgi:hypothetical protein